MALNFKKLRKATKFVIGVLLILIGSIALILLVFNISYANKVFPRVYFGKMPIGGLSEEGLKTKISGIAKDIQANSIKMIIKDQTVAIKPVDIGLDLDINATVNEGLAIGRRPTIFLSLTEQFQLLVAPKNINSHITFDEEALKNILDERLKKFEKLPTNAELDFVDNKLSVKPSEAGLVIDRDQAQSKIVRALQTLSWEKPIVLSIIEGKPAISDELLNAYLPIIREKISQPISLIWRDKKFEYKTQEMLSWITIDPKLTGQASVITNKDAIAKVIDGVAKKINRPAKDARLKLQDQKVEVFEASSNGYQLEKEKTVEAIIAALKGKNSRTIELPVLEKQPSINTAQVNDLGISELIGKGTTSFAGSPENRKHNIGNGVRILNGILIPPDGEFSTLAALGQIDDVTGFLPELVIKENRTIPEFGGGLCQVSTTLFRAALNSGLPITERRNHSWRISYYEKGVGPGLDATVYSPAPDLKFKNDTSGWILIQGSVNGNEITFEFYGTKDGRRSVIEGPTLLSSSKPPAPVYLNSSDLPQGQTKQVEKPHPGGSTIATYIVYNTDGSERNRQVFRSSYKAVPARYLVGTGATPAPEPAPTPEQAAIQTTPAPSQPVQTSDQSQALTAPADPTNQPTPTGPQDSIPEVKQ